MKLKTTLAQITLAATILSVAVSVTPVKAVTDAEMNEARLKSQSATSEIEKYENRVADLAKKQEDAANKKSELEKEAKNLDADSKKLTESIKSRNENLRAQARSAQVNTTSSSIVDILTDSESLVDAIQKVSAIVTVTDANARMLKDQQNDMKQLEAKAKALQENYRDYVKLEESLAQSSKASKTAKAELEVAQLSYQATIAKGETERASLLAAKAQAESKVQEAKADEVAATQTQESVNKARQNSTSNVEKVLSTQSQPSSNVESPSYQAPAATNPQAPTPNETPVDATPSQPSDSNQNSNTSHTSNGTVWDYRNSFMTSSSNYNGYAGGGCTDYVWQYFAQRGVIIPNVMPGNGKDWAYQMPRAPKLVPGVIASFAPGAYGSSPIYGHVAVVESVNADGSFVVSEGGAGIWGSTRTIPNSQGVTFVLP